MTTTTDDSRTTSDVGAGLDRTSELRAGALDMAPYVLGYVPLGLFLGTVVARAADPLAAWSGTLTVYGGGAQLTLLQLLDQGAPALSAVLAAGLLNARVLLYSADLVELWGDAPLWRRLLAAAAVIDVTWSLSVQRAEAPGTREDRRRHYLGAALALTVGWLVWVTVGALLSARLGPGAGQALESAAPLCLAAIVAPYLRSRPQVAAVTTAVLVAVAAHLLGSPPGATVIAAMAAAAAAGAFARRS
jgi:predicted branched-subunit amino acid permease